MASTHNFWTRQRSFVLIIALYAVAITGMLLIAAAIGAEHPVQGLISGFAASWWAGAGALAITVMFFTASIPLAEKRSAERRPGWEAYQAVTPVFFPRLRKNP